MFGSGLKGRRRAKFLTCVPRRCNGINRSSINVTHLPRKPHSIQRVHTYIYIHTHVHTHVHTHIHTHAHTYIHRYGFRRLEACHVHVCVCVCVRVCVYVCVHIYVYTLHVSQTPNCLSQSLLCSNDSLLKLPNIRNCQHADSAETNSSFTEDNPSTYSSVMMCLCVNSRNLL